MPVAPPRLHLLRLTLSEYERVAEWARWFTNPGEATHVRLARSHSGRRWICAEENVVGTLEIECDDPADDPVLAFLDGLGTDHFDIPERLLAVLPSALPAEAEEVVLGYDPHEGTVALIDGIHDLSMSHVDAGPMPAWIDTSPGHIVDIDPDPVLTVFGRRPVALDEDQLPPFVRILLTGQRVEFSRDLTPWGLGVERVGMAADVQYRADLAFHSPVALVHLAESRDPTCTVEMAFFFNWPLLVRFAQDDWMLWVIGGHRSVTAAHPGVAIAIERAGWTVDDGPDGGPSGNLSARRGEDRVTVRLLPVLGDSGAVVRIECEVDGRIPWSDELGREIAALNAAWPGDKVLHRDDRLVVVRDLSGGATDVMGWLIDYVIDRARTLTEVVGVFL